jgi:hypothetical protein
MLSDTAAAPDLEDAVARALAEPRLVGLIAREAARSWRAAAWLLERRYPERWAASRERVDEAAPTLEQIDELARLRALRQSLSGGGR